MVNPETGYKMAAMTVEEACPIIRGFTYNVWSKPVRLMVRNRSVFDHRSDN